MGGWISPHMLDHHEVLARIEARDPAFDWSDFLAGSKLAASYDGKLSGIPYRITTGILVYQKALLAKAGFAEAPGTFAEFHMAALAANAPPDRYAVGLMGKQGVGLYSSLGSWLYSAGGRLVDFKTGEIFINDDKAVTALQFMAEGTGGRTFLPSVGAALDRAFADILTELRTQYLFGFYPKDVPLTKDRFHKLEVRVSSADLRVSARNGYYGEVEGGEGSSDERVSISPDRQQKPTTQQKKTTKK